MRRCVCDSVRCAAAMEATGICGICGICIAAWCCCCCCCCCCCWFDCGCHSMLAQLSDDVFFSVENPENPARKLEIDSSLFWSLLWRKTTMM